MNEYLNKRRSSGDYGKQETLPPSLQTKMNQSFGMDFSSVKLYRNDEMSGTGMQGLASGNRVVLSREVDLNSKLGQAVLGHELSHIHAQSQGIGGGHSGLYDNAALEHQADTEGMMAANGQPIFGDRSGMNMGAGMGGMGTLTPLSGGLSANAGAPMQAKGKKPSKEEKAAEKERKLEEKRQKLDEIIYNRDNRYTEYQRRVAGHKLNGSSSFMAHLKALISKDLYARIPPELLDSGSEESYVGEDVESDDED